MKQKKSIRCPYCGGTAILRDASFVYGEKSYGGKVYVCSNYPRCDAYVGVHPGTRIPKGTLADQELRKKRMLAHQILTRSAEGNLKPSRRYHWLADKFCLSDEQAHIGMFGNYMCDQVIRESKNFWRTSAPASRRQAERREP